MRWDRFPRLACCCPSCRSPGSIRRGCSYSGRSSSCWVCRRRAAWRRFGRSERVVADDPDREPRDRRGLPGQSLWDHRSPLSPRAGRNDEQPDLLAEYRGADADSRFHPRTRAGGTAIAAPSPHHDPGASQLPGAAFVDRSRCRRARAPRPLELSANGLRRQGKDAAGKPQETVQVKERAAQGSRASSPPWIARIERSSWRLSPFRLLLYVAFSVLSLQATRNSHQFAAVVGTVTAWNFAEWAAAFRGAAAQAGGSPAPTSAHGARGCWRSPRSPCLLWVGSGPFYAMTGEGRTIGLGEEPLWFPQQAVQFAGGPEMPERFLAFTTVTPRSSSITTGPSERFTPTRGWRSPAPSYSRATTNWRIASRRIEPGWETELAEMGRPVILADHEHNSDIGATFMAVPIGGASGSMRSPRCSCTTPSAAVVREHAVDFAARHFQPDPRASRAALLSSRHRESVSQVCDGPDTRRGGADPPARVAGPG